MYAARRWYSSSFLPGCLCRGARGAAGPRPGPPASQPGPALIRSGPEGSGPIAGGLPVRLVFFYRVCGRLRFFFGVGPPPSGPDIPMPPRPISEIAFQKSVMWSRLSRHILLCVAPGLFRQSRATRNARRWPFGPPSEGGGFGHLRQSEGPRPPLAPETRSRHSAAIARGLTPPDCLQIPDAASKSHSLHCTPFTHLGNTNKCSRIWYTVRRRSLPNGQSSESSQQH